MTRRLLVVASWATVTMSCTWSHLPSTWARSQSPALGGPISRDTPGVSRTTGPLRGRRGFRYPARVSETPSDGLPGGGTVRPITRWGEPVMHRALVEVTGFDEALATLVADMSATMYAADGVGLAANQRGGGP